MGVSVIPVLPPETCVLQGEGGLPYMSQVPGGPESPTPRWGLGVSGPRTWVRRDLKPPPMGQYGPPKQMMRLADQAVSERKAPTRDKFGFCLALSLAM